MRSGLKLITNILILFYIRINFMLAHPEGTKHDPNRGMLRYPFKQVTIKI